MMKRTLIMIIAMLLLPFVAAEAGVSPRIFHNYTSGDGLADNSAQSIHCTRTGRLVITTMGQINFFNGAKFSYIDPTEENMYPLSEYQGNYHLYFDRFHHMWLKNTNTVTCVDLVTERFTESIEDEFQKFGVKETVNDLFVDSTGVVWLLTGNGLYNVENKKTYKPHDRLNLQDLEVYKKNHVMLFYNNGLMEMLDMNTGKKVVESRAYSDNDNNHFDNSSLVKLNGDIVYQIRNGFKEAILLKYDIVKKQWTEMMRTPYHLNGLAIKDSMLYVPCEYGYWEVNKHTGASVHYETLMLETGKLLETDVNVMEFDRQGGMWLGTENRGMLYSRPFTPPFHVFAWHDSRASQYLAMLKQVSQNNLFRNRRVNCVYKDSRGWTWVGTAQGLQVLRKETDMLPQVYTKADGLYNNIVHSVVEDEKHNIWVGTSYGISVVLFKDGRVHRINSYNQYDHIPNEVFVNGKAMRLPDGTILMQAIDHVIAFNPNDFSTIDGNYDFKIYPKLTGLMVNGIDVDITTEIDGNRILSKALSRVGELALNYNQNSITMTFSALNFFRPQQTYYRVRVVGLDDEWRIITPYNSNGQIDEYGMLRLPLMGLLPGHYEVEVQASLTPDNWDSKPYVWVIDINEPWWRTTGMFALLGTVLIAMLLINVFYYVKNANLKAMRNSEESMLIKRIYSFVDRLENKADILEPSPEEYSRATADQVNDLSPEFIKVMKKIAPVVATEKKKKMSMRRLSSIAGIGGKEFYQLIMDNIFKNPRMMMKQVRLEYAERLLRQTKDPIDQIAEKSGFVSTNYFIASFYQAYKVTPQKFRQRR